MGNKLVSSSGLPRKGPASSVQQPARRVAPRKKAMVLTPPDSMLPKEKRPLCGEDLRLFRSDHHLQMEDVIYALAFATTASFNKSATMDVLTYEREVLMRLYYLKPGHAPWAVVTPRDLFFRFYGDLLKQFDEHSVSFAQARTMLFSRFTALLGRSVFRGYGWVEGHGKVDSVVAKILAKTADFEDPKDALETVAKMTWALRGVNFDAEYPLPDPQNPPIPKRRGRRHQADHEALKPKRSASRKSIR